MQPVFIPASLGRCSTSPSPHDEVHVFQAFGKLEHLSMGARRVVPLLTYECNVDALQGANLRSGSTAWFWAGAAEGSERTGIVEARIKFAPQESSPPCRSSRHSRINNCTDLLREIS